MAASSDGKNEKNFLQLHRLVLDSTRVLRAKFDSFVPTGTTLQAWLPSDKDLKKAKLSDKQIRHIKQHNKSEMFDISVLTSLLRHFCYKADLKHPLWDETDNNKIVQSETGEIADIVRIRNLRNEVCIICKHLMLDIYIVHVHVIIGWQYVKFYIEVTIKVEQSMLYNKKENLYSYVKPEGYFENM